MGCFLADFRSSNDIILRFDRLLEVLLLLLFFILDEDGVEAVRADALRVLQTTRFLLLLDVIVLELPKKRVVIVLIPVTVLLSLCRLLKIPLLFDLSVNHGHFDLVVKLILSVVLSDETGFL